MPATLKSVSPGDTDRDTFYAIHDSVEDSVLGGKDSVAYTVSSVADILSVVGNRVADSDSGMGDIAPTIALGTRDRDNAMQW